MLVNRITQMNQGPHSIYNCPGRYTLQVADFSYSMCDNDKQLIAAAQVKMEEIMRAAGANDAAMGCNTALHRHGMAQRVDARSRCRMGYGRPTAREILKSAAKGCGEA